MKLTTIFINFGLMICLSLGLTACGPVKTDPGNAYLLTCSANTVKTKSHRRGIILVMPPDTNSAYNTTQMAYSTLPYKISYYSKNRWGSTPSQMLQPLIAQTLLNSGYYRAVLIPPTLSRYDYVLSTQIIKMQQDYTCFPARFILIVNAQLSRNLTSQIIASKQFVVYRPLPILTPYGGVIAANRATEEMLSELAQFVIRHSR